MKTIYLLILKLRFTLCGFICTKLSPPAAPAAPPAAADDPDPEKLLPFELYDSSNDDEPPAMPILDFAEKIMNRM